MRLTKYLGYALAACLSCFAVLPALAEPAIYAYRAAFVASEPQGVAYTRMELGLAMWRAGSSVDDQAPKSNMRTMSNHFVMVTAKPLPDTDGATPC